MSAVSQGSVSQGIALGLPRQWIPRPNHIDGEASAVPHFRIIVSLGGLFSAGSAAGVPISPSPRAAALAHRGAAIRG